MLRPGKTCAFVTLGCKVNQYDSQVLREILKRKGYQEVSSLHKADLYVINTCAVTSTSEVKSRQEIRRVVRMNPGAEVVVTGCYAKADPQSLKRLEGVARVAERVELVGAWGEVNQDPFFGISEFEGHTRAFLKIEDGCDAACSYCIIPSLRGRVRSRGLEDIVAEAQRLVARGYKEIVLTGVHMGAYGRDLHEASPVPERYKASLLDVLVRLEDIPHLRRVRLSSLEVTELNQGLIEFMAGSKRLCPHLHLPLQSGDDRILKRMNRSYTVRQYLNILDRVRARLPGPSFSTDAMVGFPGEGPEQFENTIRVSNEAGFSRMHIFPFSPRRGTPAASMPGRCSPQEIKSRKKALEALALELALRYKKSFLGKRITVLVEGVISQGMLSGYSERYIKALFPGPPGLLGEVVPVKVAEVFPGFVKAQRE